MSNRDFLTYLLLLFCLTTIGFLKIEMFFLKNPLPRKTSPTLVDTIIIKQHHPLKLGLKIGSR